MRFILLFISIIFISGCAKSWYVGEWAVTDASFPAVSALSAEEARDWFGSEAVYSESRFSFRSANCESPQFALESYKESDFLIEYRVSFARLGIEGESADILRVTCSGLSAFPGSTLIKVTSDTVYAPWDGVFFRLDRQR